MYSFGRPQGGGMGNRMQPNSFGGGGMGQGQTTDWQLGSPQSQAMFGTQNMPQYLQGGQAGGMQQAMQQGPTWGGMEAGMAMNALGGQMGNPWMQGQDFGTKPGGGGTFGMANPGFQGQFGQMMGQLPGGGGGAGASQTTGAGQDPGRLERLRGKMQDARAGGNMDRYNRLAERRQNVIGRRQNAPQPGGNWQDWAPGSVQAFTGLGRPAGTPPGGGRSVNLGGAFDSVDYAGAQPGMWQGGGGGWGGPQGFGGGNPMFGGGGFNQMQGQMPGWGWRGW